MAGYSDELQRRHAPPEPCNLPRGALGGSSESTSRLQSKTILPGPRLTSGPLSAQASIPHGTPAR
jgi:hypothetical protein